MAKKFGFDLLTQQVLEFVQGECECRESDAKGETEIEKLFFHALWCKIFFGHSECTDILVPLDETHEKSLLDCGNRYEFVLFIRPQAKIGNRLVDFLIHAWAFESKKWRSLIVECDGHDFHERTKEQAAKDRAKDREAVLEDRDSFRFTGSELWRDPFGCAEQVMDWAAKGWFQ